MKTANKIYRLKRDMSDIIEIIPSDPKKEHRIVPVEKIISTILHKIIMKKEDDFKNENSD